MWEQDEQKLLAWQPAECAQTRQNFSAYLDGAMDGHSMRDLAMHLEECEPCQSEFEIWRSMQVVLGDLGPARAPEALQAQLRDVLASELDRGTHLSPLQRVRSWARATLVPAGLRFAGGLTAALLLATGIAWFAGSAAPVQANDDRLANLNPPQYLYSRVPPEPIALGDRFVAVLVDAKVDARGRVYDYSLIDGPKDEQTRVRIESNLLDSVFKPATVFGVPVPGHLMMTYTALSVRG